MTELSSAARTELTNIRLERSVMIERGINILAMTAFR
jgi:hypothetical protein